MLCPVALLCALGLGMQATESGREWPLQSAARQPAQCLQERVWLPGSETPPAASRCVTLTLLLPTALQFLISPVKTAAIQS